VIEVLVVSFSLILARVATFVALLPVLGGNNVPRLVKAGFALALTVLWFGSWQTLPGQMFLEQGPHLHWLYYLVALGRETILGAVLGFAFSLFLVPVRVAGEYIGQEMGLTLGSLSDPTAESSSTAITQILEMLSTLLFLGLDGHHVFLAALHSTFARWPIGGALPGLPLAQLVHGTAAAQEWGLLLAAPVGVCLFLTTIALALMARVAPQLNIFSVGFALRLVVGMAAVLMLLPDLGAALISLFGRIGELLLRWG
jgi:flagellar biosynthetic protein FliR